MLKENINFIVKGYDILKTIQNKLVEIKSQKLNINDNNNQLFIKQRNENTFQKNHENTNENSNNNININSLYNPKAVYAKIFSNMNFSYAIEFSMEKFL